MRFVQSHLFILTRTWPPKAFGLSGTPQWASGLEADDRQQTFLSSFPFTGKENFDPDGNITAKGGGSEYNWSGAW